MPSFADVFPPTAATLLFARPTRSNAAVRADLVSSQAGLSQSSRRKDDSGDEVVRLPLPLLMESLFESAILLQSFVVPTRRLNVV